MYFKFALQKKCDFSDLITDELIDLEELEDLQMIIRKKKMFLFETDVIFIIPS